MFETLSHLIARLSSPRRAVVRDDAEVCRRASVPQNMRIFILCAVVLVACRSSTPHTKATEVRGLTLDAAGVAVARANVTLFGTVEGRPVTFGAESDEHGVFVLPVVPVGFHIAVAESTERRLCGAARIIVPVERLVIEMREP